MTLRDAGECPVCKGTGEVFHNPSGDPQDETSDVCRVCLGTGARPAPKIERTDERKAA